MRAGEAFVFIINYSLFIINYSRRDKLLLGEGQKLEGSELVQTQVFKLQHQWSFSQGLATCQMPQAPRCLMPGLAGHGEEEARRLHQAGGAQGSQSLTTWSCKASEVSPPRFQGQGGSEAPDKDRQSQAGTLGKLISDVPWSRRLAQALCWALSQAADGVALSLGLCGHLGEQGRARMVRNEHLGPGSRSRGRATLGLGLGWGAGAGGRRTSGSRAGTE